MTVVDLISILALVLLNGFFVATEYALISSHPAKLKTSDDKPRRGTTSALWLMDRMDLALSTSQLGITVASLLLGWVGVNVFLTFFENFSTFSPLSFSFEVVHFFAVLFAIVLVTFAHVVFGELVAKALAIRYPEITLRLFSVLVVVLCQLCRPIIYLVSRTANFFLAPFGTTIAGKGERLLSVSELSLFVSHNAERGVFDKDEEKMIRGVFGFSETVAREVMTPRTDLVTISLGASLDEVARTIIDSGFSRFPVRGEKIDDILGLLLARDLFPLLFRREPGDAPPDFSVRRLMRQSYFIPGTKPIDDLLNEFKRRKLHMAIVLDEHGGVDGVVTLEDLLEEIVGDIYDELDEAEPEVIVEENGDLLVDGGILVADLNERYDIGIPEGDYDTIAGFIFTSLGRMPKNGDTITIGSSGEVVSEDMLGVCAPIAENGSNGDSAPETSPSSNEEPIRACITVERVESHRIETVRLRHIGEQQLLESPPEASASEEKGGELS